MLPDIVLGAQIHDLLALNIAPFLSAHRLVPDWVHASLHRAPFAVVRRGEVTAQGIPVGVRGSLRNQRWAAFCQPNWITRIDTPPGLVRAPRFMGRAAETPAVRALYILIERWRHREIVWGPAGSVGFELATGEAVTNAQSDLDVVLYADTPLMVVAARELCASVADLPVAVDIRVETKQCGFSLFEYAQRSPAPLLLRTAAGARFGSDPWELER